MKVVSIIMIIKKILYNVDYFFNIHFLLYNLLEVYRMWDFQYSRIRMRILHFNIRGYRMRMRILYIYI